MFAMMHLDFYMFSEPNAESFVSFRNMYQMFEIHYCVALNCFNSYNINFTLTHS